MELEENAEFGFDNDMEDVYELLVDGEGAIHELIVGAGEVLAIESVGEATDGCHELALGPNLPQLLFFIGLVHDYNFA